MGSNTDHAKVGACEHPDGMAVEYPTPRTSSLPLRGSLEARPQLTPVLDVQGWLDKLYRRSSSKGTTDSAAKGLAAFEEFVRQRHSTLRGTHPHYPYTDGAVGGLQK